MKQLNIYNTWSGKGVRVMGYSPTQKKIQLYRGRGPQKRSE